MDIVKLAGEDEDLPIACAKLLCVLSRDEENRVDMSYTNDFLPSLEACLQVQSTLAWQGVARVLHSTSHYSIRGMHSYAIWFVHAMFACWQLVAGAGCEGHPGVGADPGCAALCIYDPGQPGPGLLHEDTHG